MFGRILHIILRSSLNFSSFDDVMTCVNLFWRTLTICREITSKEILVALQRLLHLSEEGGHSGYEKWTTWNNVVSITSFFYPRREILLDHFRWHSTIQTQRFRSSFFHRLDHYDEIKTSHCVVFLSKKLKRDIFSDTAQWQIQQSHVAKI